MAWNSPVIWVDDTTPGAADFNAQLRDNLNYLKGVADVPYIENPLELPESATPTTPASGRGRIYPKSDKLFYTLDSAGQEYPLGRFRARAYNSGNISATNSTVTTITLDTERYDTRGFHSTSSNTNRMTIPVTGIYLVGGHVRFGASATGQRVIYLRRNGATFIAIGAQQAVSGGPTDANAVTLASFTAGDYADMAVFQDSGGALNVLAATEYTPELWIVGPL